MSEAEELREALKWALPLVELTLENCRQERLRCGHSDIGAGTDHVGLWDFEIAQRDRIRALVVHIEPAMTTKPDMQTTAKQ